MPASGDATSGAFAAPGRLLVLCHKADLILGRCEARKHDLWSMDEVEIPHRLKRLQGHST